MISELFGQLDQKLPAKEEKNRKLSAKKKIFFRCFPAAADFDGSLDATTPLRKKGRVGLTYIYIRLFSHSKPPNYSGVIYRATSFQRLKTSQLFRDYMRTAITFQRLKTSQMFLVITTIAIASYGGIKKMGDRCFKLC